MTLETWLAFCATEAVLCFIPGPAVLFVTSVAVARGARPGMAAALGILFGNTLYFVLSATSVAATIVASSRLFSALQWAGACYLGWMGLRMLLGRADVPLALSPRVVSQAFVRGFVVQATNPKALVFFVALLPQFIDPRGAVGWQVFGLGVSSVVIELLVLTLYVLVAVRARALAGAGLAGPLERLGGGLLLAAGLRLALVRGG